MIGRPMAEVLESARVHAGLSVNELWLAYAVLGGTATLEDVSGFLAGALEPSLHQYDVLAHALNERFVDQGMNHPVPYADDRE